MTVTVTKSARDPKIITLNNVRIGYAMTLNEPKAVEEGKDKRYNCVLFIPDTDTAALKAIDDVVLDAVVDKFGGKGKAIHAELKAALKSAVKSGAAKQSRPGFEGNHYISPSSREDSPPKLFHKYLGADGKVQELKRPQKIIYSGCYVKAQIAVWVQDNQFGRRVNTEILAVQFQNEGERFAASAVADESAFGGEQPVNDADMPF